MKQKKKKVRHNFKNISHEIQGVFQAHASGYGFVLSDLPSQKDVFIPAHFIKNALNGDLVSVQVKNPTSSKPEGKITKIIKRSQKEWMGEFHASELGGVVVLRRHKTAHGIEIESQNTLGAKTGDVVLIQLIEDEKKLKAKIIKIIGPKLSPHVEQEMTLHHFRLRTEFPAEVIKEAKNAKKFLRKEDEQRVDLRHLPFVTIDGESAKDFDDGICVFKTKNNFQLLVAIADVSYYVQPQSIVDKEAYLRSTSVYFPNRCTPMLPEVLSNDLCSLVPNQDRLVFVAEMTFDLKGKKTQTKFYSALICSKARLTYNSVHSILIEKQADLISSLPEQIMLPLQDAYELFCLLRSLRLKRGSIDFDLPEPEIILDENQLPLSILRAERNDIHMLIEEFMLAANESVAEYFVKHKALGLYRIHDTPNLEKISDFYLLLKSFGHELPPLEKLKSKDLAKILEKVKGKTYEKLINTVLLRSLKQAKYSIQNLGHFGLALKNYTHFTSPIRRYPDLLVHRLLKAYLQAPKNKKIAALPYSSEALDEMSKHCSAQERIAMKAEWEIRDLHTAYFMQSKVGEICMGVISSVTRFGFFVELSDYFVEGLVGLKDLGHYAFYHDEKKHALISKRTQFILRIGDVVKVEILKVDVALRRIDFKWVESRPKAI